jgi:hypothetical protein
MMFNKFDQALKVPKHILASQASQLCAGLQEVSERDAAKEKENSIR